MPTILSESLEHSIGKWLKKAKLVPILISFFMVIFTLLFVRDLAQRSALSAIDGQLPYPGVMQDSPLYPLKRFRDDFLVVTTRDPIDRALLYRHLSDKAVSAAQLASTCENAGDSVRLSVYYLQQMRKALDQAQNIGLKPEILSTQHTERAFIEHKEALSNVYKRCKNERSIVVDAQKNLNQTTQWFLVKYKNQ